MTPAQKTAASEKRARAEGTRQAAVADKAVDKAKAKQAEADAKGKIDALAQSVEDAETDAKVKIDEAAQSVKDAETDAKVKIDEAAQSVKDAETDAKVADLEKSKKPEPLIDEPVTVTSTTGGRFCRGGRCFGKAPETVTGYTASQLAAWQAEDNLQVSE